MHRELHIVAEPKQRPGGTCAEVGVGAVEWEVSGFDQLDERFALSVDGLGCGAVE